MPDLKCPYCQEVRASRSRLAYHLDCAHRDVHPFEVEAAIHDAREVEDVDISASPLSPDAVPAEQLQKAVELGDRLNAVGAEIREINGMFRDIDNRLERLNRTTVIDPSVLRRNTLNQVWDKLMDVGHASAAMVVMDMIRNTP